jgi:hypothetical protein
MHARALYRPNTSARHPSRIRRTSARDRFRSGTRPRSVGLLVNGGGGGGGGGGAAAAAAAAGGDG